MNNSSDKNKKWVSSREAIKIAKIKDCDLMHHRLRGNLDYVKRGNAYFYSEDSIEKIKKPNSK